MSITAPRGFLAGGIRSGVKKQKKDLTLIVSERPAAWAGCFTRNVVKAAPVIYDQRLLPLGRPVRGVVINSGNANACTGARGLADAESMARCLAGLLDCEADEILVGSTGVIGVALPMDVILSGVRALAPRLSNDEAAGLDAMEGIMTTDTIAKIAVEKIILGGKDVTIAGMAKGSGMIHPNMGTMLAYITTDADISQALLQKVLSDSVRVTYNMVSVDGDTSTNDTVLILANGFAGNESIQTEDKNYQMFCEALHRVNRKLAKEIARDGEGASKLMEVTVSGADSEEDARLMARAVASSNLFKAALFGADANWGRVLCAMGYSGARFDPEKIQLIFRGGADSIAVMAHGDPIAFDEALAKKILSEKEIVVDIGMGNGKTQAKAQNKDEIFAATAWGCDLTYDYVRINGEYRS
ncbi:MAG: bifunctional glutamate N-acetyltransferase/amino-acid acetyltransferase ArgJ [Clostridiales bacterium]|nr:bifunctional glutamate N-acetyltransferase/amino-acid acetyltransferase ArgJ [Clostridiales bacterium]